MNIGMVLVAFLLVAGAIFGIFAIAASSQEPIVDTFGAEQTNVTNQTQGMITNTTSPLMAAAGGLAVFIGVLIVFIAAIVLIVSVKSSLHGRR
jgi:uncharacterized BrkB/YihY/UPF0761 family membrane protein